MTIAAERKKDRLYRSLSLTRTANTVRKIGFQQRKPGQTENSEAGSLVNRITRHTIETSQSSNNCSVNNICMPRRLVKQAVLWPGRAGSIRLSGIMSDPVSVMTRNWTDCVLWSILYRSIYYTLISIHFSSRTPLSFHFRDFEPLKLANFDLNFMGEGEALVEIWPI